ncbi:glycosyltransferase [Microbacterium gilvum]
MTDTTVRVLESVAAPGPTIKYIDQVVRHAPADIKFLYFSWWRALLGRYDVLHIHWPEFLMRSRTPWARRVQRILFRALLLRLRLARTPVVRTLHNLEPHERGDEVEVRLLAKLDTLTTARVLINGADTGKLSSRDRVVLHGDYREQFSEIQKSESVPGRLLFFGRIEPYKSVPELIEAFEISAEPGSELRVVGKPTESTRQQIESRVERWGRADASVTTRLEHISDAEMVAEMTSAEAIVLPYREMHNSGVLLVALSLGRPVIAPRSAANDAIAREVGPGWVVSYDGDFDSAALSRALSELRQTNRAVPDLNARDWRTVAAGYAEVFRAEALATGRKARVQIFVNVGGQRDNIGDSLLRRAYLDALRGCGDIHAYTGPDSGYNSGLGLRDTDHSYESPAAWLLMAFLSGLRHRGTVFAANTGEVVGTDVEYRKGRWQEPLSLLLKIRGGRTLLAGVSVRPGSSIDQTSLRTLSRRAAFATWRDTWTRDAFGVGEVQPDWAFALGGAADDDGSDRDVLAIAMRGDRPLPGDAWVSDVREVISATQARPVVVVQVRRDAERARELAALFDADIMDWPVSDDHSVQEARVRELYRSSVAVISDRIHALIVGLTEGAVPLGFSTGSPEKVTRSLSTVVSTPFFARPGEGQRIWLDALRSRSTTLDDLEQARGQLAQVRARIDETIAR